MNPIENLAEQADQIFEKAEIIAQSSPQEAVVFFRKGVGLLFQAYLSMADTESSGNFGEDYQKCLAVEPEFEQIEEAFELLSENNHNVDAEDIIDAANEIWDFISELISD